MRIKPLEDILTKWASRAAQATSDFEEGVRNPRTPWESATLQAEDTYKIQVIAAANAGRFGEGVRRCGNDRWQSRTLTLGVPRWAQGIAASGPEYERGFRPYHKLLSAIVLPPRYGRGDERNLLRVAEISKQLHRARVG